MTDPMKTMEWVELALDVIRAEAAYLRIAAAHRAEQRALRPVELMDEVREALPDMPRDRRVIAMATVLRRQR
jgi:hypothetical protein